MNGLAETENGDLQSRAKISQYVTVHVSGQYFGLPVLVVNDVIKAVPMTRIPLAPKVVAGAMNLRGRIVTALDLKVRLGISGEEESKGAYNVVVEHNNDLYSVMVERIGEVLSLGEEDFEKNPVNLESPIKEMSAGVYKLQDRLMVVLDMARLIENFT